MPTFNSFLGARSAAALALGFLAGLTAPAPAAAQVAPTATEAAGYRGLHAAAFTGNVAEIRKLAGAKADLDARDAHGRTPLHVATFARQREALR
ncbi:MAG TPA: ankyrin repeat domain-containing protein, partial [Ramlibacter sp.]|nr:ankyrin repeat domain-containing protein [Ramlibacter sp.]